MRTVFFIGLFILWSLSVSAQLSSTLLPNWVIDSLIFEAKYSRQCDTVRIAQQFEIESIHKELNSYGVALKLSQSSNETLSGLLNNSKESNSIQALQFQNDLNSEKKKVRRWRKVAILETVGLIGIGLLILL